MAKKVAGELYESITGQFFEIGRQLRQPNGYPYDPMKLKRHLQNAIEGKFGSVSASVLVHDKIKNGWTLLEHTPRRITAVRDLELVSFLKCGENSVKGEEVVRRARVEFDSNYGQEDAEYLLDHQNEIPTEFRSFHLPFTATVWQDSDGRRLVSCLGWYGGLWCLDFDWIGHDWYLNARLVRPRK